MEKVEDKRVRVFKFDEKTEIKNFLFLEKKYFHCTRLLVILGDYLGVAPLPYLFLDGILTSQRPMISTPENYGAPLAKYLFSSMSAVVQDQLHFFGGRYSPRRVSDSLRVS